MGGSRQWFAQALDRARLADKLSSLPGRGFFPLISD